MSGTPAHAALGDAYRRRYLATFDPALLQQAQTSVERAVALAPAVAFVRTANGLVLKSTGGRAPKAT